MSNKRLKTLANNIHVVKLKYERNIISTMLKVILESFPSDPKPKTIVNVKLNTKNAQRRKKMIIYIIDYTGHKEVILFKGLLSTPSLQECK